MTKRRTNVFVLLLLIGKLLSNSSILNYFVSAVEKEPEKLLRPVLRIKLVKNLRVQLTMDRSQNTGANLPQKVD
jgi:hypothetical protein